MNYQEIVSRQNAFFNTGHTKNIDFRIAQLRKLKAIVHQHESNMYDAIYRDFKKSEFDTYSQEFSYIYREIDLVIKKLPGWSKRKHVKTNLVLLPGRSYIIPEPLGTCLIISAWNYPYQLIFLPLISAIASGNTMVLKPSEIPSATSAAMAKMINENFPPEYINITEGGIPETTMLLEQKFDKIFFTGSPSVGKIVYQAAAKQLTPVTLELGGKSPAIVTKNTNLKAAAKRIVWAKFLNAGQTCIAPDYLLVDQGVKDELLTHMKHYIAKFDYTFQNNNYVQIINEQNFHRLIGLMDKHKIYYGGENDLATRYIAPTIVTDVTFDAPLMAEEIFGPILPVITYSDLDQEIAKMKYLPKPLALYLFTHDLAIKQKVVREISFGGGAINHAMLHHTNDRLPFGGVGQSGTGSYHGKAGFDTFSHFKAILEKPFWGEPELMYPPFSNTKLTWLKRLLRI